MGSGSGKHVAEDTVGNDLSLGCRDVGVFYGGTDVLVAEAPLHKGKVRAIPQQVGRITVLQNMRIYAAFFDPGEFGSLAE
jgi:hypothetical protein